MAGDAEQEAKFATLCYGENETKIVNIDSEMRHVYDYVAQLLNVQLSARRQLDFATDRGKLMDIGSHLEESSDKVIKSRTVIIPVLIVDAQVRELGSAESIPGSHHPHSESNRELASRASSARSVSRKSTKRPQSVATGEDKEESKLLYKIMLSQAALTAKAPAFELSKGGTRVKRTLVLKWEDELPNDDNNL